MTRGRIQFEIIWERELTEELLEQTSVSPLVDMRVKVGDTYVVGTEESVAGDWIATHLCKQLEAALGLLEGESQLIRSATAQYI